LQNIFALFVKRGKVTHRSKLLINGDIEMNNAEHLISLTRLLANEKKRLKSAVSDDEKSLRKVWVTQLEKEFCAEIGIEYKEPVEMSDDELLTELFT